MTGPLRRIRRAALAARATVAATVAGWALEPLERDEATGARLFAHRPAGPRLPETAARVREALRLLAASRPTNIRWLRRHVRQVVFVSSLGRPAAFERVSASIFIEVDPRTDLDAGAYVAILAHEITHARIYAGNPFVRDTTSHRVRIERRCAREELAALTAIDPAHPFVPWSRERAEGARDAELVLGPADRRMVRRLGYRRYRRLRLPPFLARGLVKLLGPEEPSSRAKDGAA